MIDYLAIILLCVIGLMLGLPALTYLCVKFGVFAALRGRQSFEDWKRDHLNKGR